MNRVAVWVAQTAVGATVPMALAQAGASPLSEIEAGARLDPDIARRASASNALTVLPVTAANDSGFMTETVLFRCQIRPASREQLGTGCRPARAAERGSQA